MSASSILLWLFPNQKLIKPLKAVICLTLICIIASPITNFLSSLLNNDLPEFSTDSIYNENACMEIMNRKLSEYSASALENELCKHLCVHFGIKENNLDISVDHHIENGGVVFDRVLVCVSGSAIFKDPKEIEKYITNLCGLDCDCVI